ncbi:hypothetical protein VB776_22285 [Arcicella sp. DC2W]|uniref:Fibronectin type-III domain-containing protein n=1 Tax=Arcicella gelida TaxID=2984195 RepID=A0ABU5SB53_9BACT|nr:hypothetical protein [Arcicella sp. DC2W]MEA5405684.1 hypothetical protein [Arcicella sp. DC2W]
MSIVKIIISFTKLRDDDLDTKSLVILNSLTGNANFSNPQPSLADIAASRDAYINALSANETGGKQQTLVKNEARKNLEAKLRLLGLYVQANCNNNEVIAQGSGFDIQKSRTPTGILERPTNFKVENGPASGTLVASSDKVDGAKTYVYQITTAPVSDNSIWQTEYASTKTHMFVGLTPGTQYAVKMAGIGVEPMLIYSDILMRFVS